MHGMEGVGFMGLNDHCRIADWAEAVELHGLRWWEVDPGVTLALGIFEDFADANQGSPTLQPPLFPSSSSAIGVPRVACPPSLQNLI